ncbi:MAG: aldo/keto reductase [Thermoflexales bacterium]
MRYQDMQSVATGRRIGRSELLVVPLCLGGNVFGWTVDEAQSFAILDAFVAAGGNFIDTADMYSTWVSGNQGGESETIIGRWMALRGNRNKLIIATKVGQPMPGGGGLGAAWITRAVEDSLRRLQTDYIDLYQAHIDDQSTPLEETLLAFDRLIQQGKVRYIGASNYSGARLREALQLSARMGIARYECLQPLYNAVERDFERDQRPVCLEYEIGVIPYFALAAGFLTGKYRRGEALPNTPRAAGVQKRYFNDHAFAVLDKVEQLARECNATPAQVALAWLMHQPTVTAPIASATSVAQVEEIMGALQLKLPDGAEL